jgi:hypothetical protein
MGVPAREVSLSRPCPANAAIRGKPTIIIYHIFPKKTVFFRTYLSLARSGQCQGEGEPNRQPEYSRSGLPGPERSSSRDGWEGGADHEVDIALRREGPIQKACPMARRPWPSEWKLSPITHRQPFFWPGQVAGWGPGRCRWQIRGFPGSPYRQRTWPDELSGAIHRVIPSALAVERHREGPRLAAAPHGGSRRAGGIRGAVIDPCDDLTHDTVWGWHGHGPAWCRPRPRAP